MTIAEGLNQLRNFPFQKSQSGFFDTGREIRRGIAEAIFCRGKTTDQISDLFLTQAENAGPTGFVLATHASKSVFQLIEKKLKSTQFFPEAEIMFYGTPKKKLEGTKLNIVSAGTADRRVVAEAQISAQLMGNHVQTFQDLGVAALSRLINHLEEIRQATCLIVVAGMDGALASVVSGLTQLPLVAVPTSTGYGSAYQGISALLAMLNTCSPGLSVVNIDNGYGAACCATLMHQTFSTHS